MIRIGRERLHLVTAHLWSERSICKRAKVGAVITTSDYKQILSFGYNGPARGLPDASCNNLEGSCGCLHAEANALLHCSDRRDKVVFTTCAPCYQCAQFMIQSGVIKVFYSQPYRITAGIDTLQQVEISCYHIPLDTLLPSIQKLRDSLLIEETKYLS